MFDYLIYKTKKQTCFRISHGPNMLMLLGFHSRTCYAQSTDTDV